MTVGSSRQPEVTIVIPAYNAAMTIGDCLESVLDGDYPFERRKVIVVDNNSIDGTTDIVRTFPVELKNEKIQTPAAARNKGIAQCSTEIVAFVDSDCIAEKDWLSKLIEPFDNPCVGVVGGRIVTRPIADDGKLTSRYLAHVQSTAAAYQSDQPKAFPTGNVAYRVEALQQVGAFDACLPSGEDIDLALRVQTSGNYLGIHVPEAVVYHEPEKGLQAHHVQFRRYGRTDIVLATLFKDQSIDAYSAESQIRILGRQLGSLLIYCASFCVRLTRWGLWKRDKMYLMHPILRTITELSSISGKIEGLLDTRFFKRNPYATCDPQIIKARIFESE